MSQTQEARAFGEQTAMAHDFDCIIVGLGPSGLMLAAYLSRMGHRVAAVERHASLYGLPRAGHLDHEIVRYLQDLQVVDEFLPDAHPAASYSWYNADGNILLNIFDEQLSVSGYASDYMMYQPVLEDALVRAVDGAKMPPCMFRGHELIAFEQNSEGVNVRLSRCAPALETGEVTLSGRYLLAADGAGSGVRNQLGIARKDFGFNEVWLDVDAKLKRPIAHVEPYQICDPARPIYIGPLGRRHHRWEWAILPTEDPEEFKAPAKAWNLLAERGIGPDDVEIVRQQVYTFEARMAEQWRDGRVFLLGDAAHTMPPFMGQGACSGMRDAANLAWKMDLVLRGVADDALFDSYQAEREPHTTRWIEISMQTGAISCTLDPVAAANRDAELLSGDAPPLPPLPRLDSGLIDRPAAGAPTAAGTPFPQRVVSLDGRSARFDDLAGYGFKLIGLHGLNDHLSSVSAVLLRHLDIKPIVIGEGGVIDPTDFYAEWFEEQGIVAALVRPDHLIFGVAASPSDVDLLVGRLATAMQPQSQPFTI